MCYFLHFFTKTTVTGNVCVYLNIHVCMYAFVLESVLVASVWLMEAWN